MALACALADMPDPLSETASPMSAKTSIRSQPGQGISRLRRSSITLGRLPGVLLSGENK